jgi:hypothetical protein
MKFAADREQTNVKTRDAPQDGDEAIPALGSLESRTDRTVVSEADTSEPSSFGPDRLRPGSDALYVRRILRENNSFI